MKLKNMPLLSLTSIILIGLSGCAKYSARPIKPIVTVGQSAENSIAFSYKVFNTVECKRYLGRNALAKGYQPIQVTITNNTNHYFNISPSSFSCNCLDPDEVAENMHSSTVGRAVGYGVPAFLLFPILAIPAIVDGIGSSKANHRLDDDYAQKSLSDETIAPYTTINGVIFVSRGEYTDNITVTLADGASNKRYTLSKIKPVLQV